MKKILFNSDWQFAFPGGQPVAVELPHTWNGKDGQDGGNDYKRCACTYTKKFDKPELKQGERCYIVFKGVNSEAIVNLNGKEICRHEGGYSTFGADVTQVLEQENELIVTADNTPNERVYPQTAIRSASRLQMRLPLSAALHTALLSMSAMQTAMCSISARRPVSMR